MANLILENLNHFDNFNFSMKFSFYKNLPVSNNWVYGERKYFYETTYRETKKIKNLCLHIKILFSTSK